MILVTGGTGSIGKELIRLLSSKGVLLRALVRRPETAGEIRLPGVELVQGDFSDSASIAAALKGIDCVLLLAPPVPELYKLECEFIDQAAAAGIKHLVNVSAVGASVGAAHRFGDWHGKTEQALFNSGLNYTILRPSFFMQNLIGMAGMIQGGTIYVPAGRGKAPFVDVRDIASVAAACLTEPGHGNQIYEVTGPESIGYQEIAEAFTRVLGGPVQYIDIPPEMAAKNMVESGMPSWLADALNELNTGLKENRFSEASDVVSRIAKKTPMSIEQFIRDNKDVFGGV